MKNEITLIIPKCADTSKTLRLEGVLRYALDGVDASLVNTLEGFTPINNKRIIFAITVGESGVNLEYYAYLKKLRMNDHFFDGCVAGIIVDGKSEQYTKSIACELVHSANASGCTFVGAPLVEATGSMTNFITRANNSSTTLEEAYKNAARELVGRVMSFCPSHEETKILALHASEYKTSNTLALWSMIKEGLPCDVKEITLRNGTIMDCRGCGYKTCRHFGDKGTCFYGGAIVSEVFPALVEADTLVMLCPNYNDALGANLAAFINRLTSLYTKTRFYEKRMFAIVVSGYSGGDIVAKQLISGLCMNKSFSLAPRFAMIETALEPHGIVKLDGIQTRAAEFGRRLMKDGYS